MKKLLLLLAILPFAISCNGQNNNEADKKKYSNIENFNKNTSPKEYRKKLEKDSISLQTEEENNSTEYILNEKETEDGKKIQWEQFNVECEYKEQSVGYLNKIKLRRLQFINYKNKLIGVTGSSKYTDSLALENTIEYLTKKYGKPKDLAEIYFKKSKIGSGFFHYYWENKEKIIGIGYKGEEGDFISKEDFDKNKATMFSVYEVYLLNKDALNELKNENIELEDFFGGMVTSMDNENLSIMLNHKKSEK